MIEAVPRSAKLMIDQNVIPAFCEKLTNIEYIDVAEQTLQALGSLSKEYPVEILRAGGLMAMLAFVDFFSISVQRSIASTAANLCKNIPPDCFDNQLCVFPMISALLTRDDSKVQYYALLCYLRLAQCFQRHDYDVEQYLATPEVLPVLLNLLGQFISDGNLPPAQMIVNTLELFIQS